MGSLLLQPIIGQTSKNVLTTTSVGMYQIGSGMYEWASDLTRRLISRREGVGRPLRPDDALQEYERNPEWVNDDTLLIAMCLRDTAGRAASSTAVILVSADKRLGHQMSNTCNCAVIRVDPREYIQLCSGLGMMPLPGLPTVTLASFMNRNWSGPPILYSYYDTGSINSFLSRIEEMNTEELKIFSSPDACGGSSYGDPRTVSYRVLTIPIRRDVRYSIHYPVLRQKRYRVGGSSSSEVMSRKSAMTFRSRSSNNWRSGI